MRFAILVCIIGYCFAVEVVFQDCGSTKGTVSSVDISPCDNPKQCDLIKGTSPKVSITFTPKEDSGRVKAVVKGILPGGIKAPFNLPNDDGCTDSGLTCPLTTGTTVTYSQSIPVKEVYPSWKVGIQWQLQDEQENDLACIVVRAQIKPGAVKHQ